MFMFGILGLLAVGNAMWLGSMPPKQGRKNKRPGTGGASSASSSAAPAGAGPAPAPAAEAGPPRQLAPFRSSKYGLFCKVPLTMTRLLLKGDGQGLMAIRMEILPSADKTQIDMVEYKDGDLGVYELPPNVRLLLDRPYAMIKIEDARGQVFKRNLVNTLPPEQAELREHDPHVESIFIVDELAVDWLKAECPMMMDNMTESDDMIGQCCVIQTMSVAGDMERPLRTMLMFVEGDFYRQLQCYTADHRDVR